MAKTSPAAYRRQGRPHAAMHGIAVPPRSTFCLPSGAGLLACVP